MIEDAQENSDKLRKQIIERLAVGEKRAYLSDDGECVVLVWRQKAIDENLQVKTECIPLELAKEDQ